MSWVRIPAGFLLFVIFYPIGMTYKISVRTIRQVHFFFEREMFAQPLKWVDAWKIFNRISKNFFAARWPIWCVEIAAPLSYLVFVFCKKFALLNFSHLYTGWLASAGCLSLVNSCKKERSSLNFFAARWPIWCVEIAAPLSYLLLTVVKRTFQSM